MEKYHKFDWFGQLLQEIRFLLRVLEKQKKIINFTNIHRTQKVND